MNFLLRTFVTLSVLLIVAILGALWLAYNTTGGAQILAHCFLMPGHLLDMALGMSLQGQGGTTGKFTIGFGTWFLYMMPLLWFLRLALTDGSSPARDHFDDLKPVTVCELGV